MKELSPLKIIDFRKNFGQTASMDAGFKAARGKYIVTMDGDLQNDPADIPKLMAYLEEHDLDVVSGWRKNRHDSFSKKFFSRGANLLRKIIVNDGIHDSGCSLKIYRSMCFEGLDLYGEMHRFIPALLKIKGYSIGEVEVKHHPRVSGKSKYGYARILKGFLDMLSVWFWDKYSNRPLHLFGAIGAFLVLISFVAGLWVVYQKIAFGYDLSDTFMTTLAMLGFLTGIQFLVFGVIADMLAKTYFSEKKDTAYAIKEVHGSGYASGTEKEHSRWA